MESDLARAFTHTLTSSRVRNGGPSAGYVNPRCRIEWGSCPVSGMPEAVQCELSSVEVPFGGIAMAKLIYMANTSLDGYTEDRDGGIDFGTPDEEYFSFINDLERPVGTYLYGRRMYEAMVYWETAPIADQPPWVVDFTNIWRAADKVVFSKTLTSVSSGRTTLEREFDVEAIRRMKADGHARSHGGRS